MGLVSKMDDMGKAGWIGLLVLSFFVFWPAALALLAFLIWSGRMGCWGNADRWQHKMDRMQAKMDNMRDKASRWGGWEPPSSGNRAFDEYRSETLRRLEEEQKEFKDFLERLRHARDKAEFDQFMADRKGRRDEGPAAQPT